MQVIPFARNKFINLTRRQHKFFCLERVTIADRQGAREDQKFVAKPTQLNMNLFLANGINMRLLLFAGISNNQFSITNWLCELTRKRDPPLKSEALGGKMSARAANGFR
jgi:hypothetical protein